MPNEILPIINQVKALVDVAVDWSPSQPLPPAGSTVCFTGAAGSACAELSAPLSGRACVWFQAVNKDNWLARGRRGLIMPTPPATAFEAPQTVLSTLFPVQRGLARGGVAPMRLSEPHVERSTAEFLVVAGGVELRIDPQAAALIDCHTSTVNEMVHDANGNDLELCQEWIIESNDQLLCFGTVAAVDGTLRLLPDRSGTLLVTTRSKGELLSMIGPGREVVQHMRRTARRIAITIAGALVVLLVLLVVWAVHILS